MNSQAIDLKEIQLFNTLCRGESPEWKTKYCPGTRTATDIPFERSHPEAGTEALDNTYLDTVLYQYRTFQRYSIENDVYFAPIDEVLDL